LSEELAERARGILRAPLQWEELAETAWRHGVASLLFRNLQALGAPQSVIPGRLHLLRQCYVRAAFRTQMHYAAIAEILDRSAAAGLEIVLLKGAALARTIYHDPMLRPFADIDLLAREKRVGDAKQLLVALGYEIAPDLLSEKFNRKYHNNLPLVRRAPQPIHLELHWRLSDAFSLTAFDHEALFARAPRVSIAEGVAQVLAPEDQFVYLAAHLDNHGYLNRLIVDRNASGEFSLHELSGNRLIWFTDLHELSSLGIDWTKVLDAACAAHASEALAVSLRLLRSLLGTPIPERVLEQLPLPEVRWPERKVGKYVFGLAAKLSSDSSVTRFQQRFLSTRKDFELRLIRLIDLWQYVFPNRAEARKFYAVHVCAAVFQCSRMFLELLCRRAFRLVRAKDFT